MLHIITGRAKSGKSYYCSVKFSEAARDPASPSYFIVPEQYAMEAEKRIFSLDSMRSGVLLNSEVLSFKRLVHRILGKLGGGSGELLPAYGRAMLLSSVLSGMSHEKALGYYTGIAEKPAEILTLLKFFDELELYNSDSSLLLERLSSAADIANGTQKVKYNDLLNIFIRFSDKVNQTYLSGTKAWDVASSLSEKSGFFSGASIWIDEFTGFTDAELRMISCMLEQKANVTVTLCTSRLGEPVFYAIDKTLDRLKQIAVDASAGVKVSDISELTAYDPSRDHKLLRSLERTYTSLKPAPVDQSIFNNSELEAVSLHSSPDLYSEVTDAAKKIAVLAEAGYAYSDIAVAVRNINDYNAYIGPVFEKYKIPFYIDDVRAISPNPAVITIVSLLDLYIYGMRRPEVIRLLKNGFIVGSRDRQDELENYILSHNMRYASRYMTSDVIELRELYGLYASIKYEFSDAKDPGAAADGFIKLLKELNIDEKALAISEELEACGKYDAADEFRRIWNIILDVLDLSRKFLGFEQPCEGVPAAMMLKKFIEIGFAGLKIGFIPQEQNAVRIAGIGRSRIGSPAVTLLLGVNEGVMPAEVSDTGILRDIERDELESIGIGLADSSLSRAYKELFMIYSALFSPSDRLYVSYALKNGKGDELLPSARIINKLKAALPWLDTDQSPEVDEAVNDPETESAQPEFDVSPELSRALLLRGEEPVMSISQIESYNRCPLSYLLDRGLKLRERDEGEFKAADLGSIMHAVVEKGGMDLAGAGCRTMSEEEIGRYAASLSEKYFYETVREFYPEFDVVYTPKNKLIMSRLKEFCAVVLNAVGRQYKKSSFSTLAFECEFGGGGILPPVKVKKIDDPTKNIYVCGRIDRLDAFSDGSRIYISVVDYKSSAKKISEHDISEGLMIQLITYMKAATESREGRDKISDLAGSAGLDTVPGAGLYFVFGDGINAVNDRTKIPAEADAGVNKSFRMSGIVIGDDSIAENLGGSDADGVISIPREGPLPEEKFTEYSGMVDNAVAVTANKICKGIFGPVPKVRSLCKIACEYCPFMSVCCAEIS